MAVYLIVSIFVTTISAILLMSLLSKEPLVLCLLLITAAFFIGCSFGAMASKWLFYAILLIFLGGMMVIFLYVSTLSLSSKMTINFHLQDLALPMVSILIILFVSTQNITDFSSSSLLSQLYQPMSGPLVMFLVTYLLTALFSVVKITESFKGALAKNW